MSDFIAACVCLVLALAVVMLRKAYFNYPEFELKRRAATGDSFARAVYPAVAYGYEFRALLWLLLAVLSAVAIVLFDHIAPLGIDVILVIIWLGLAFSWLPNTRPTRANLRLAELLAPFFTWLLNWSYPAVKQLAKLQKHYRSEHTGVYETDDLRRLLQAQARQPDNRIPVEQLSRLAKLVEFERSSVGAYLKPWKDTLKLAPEDSIGPKLLDEMHRSNQSAFIVTKSKNSRVVNGILAKDRVGLNSSGKVADYMMSDFESISEDASIEQALAQFAHGSALLLVVLDKEEQPVGILTLKEALSELLLPEPVEEEKPATKDVPDQAQLEKVEVEE